jgi:hypothetical protein
MGHPNYEYTPHSEQRKKTASNLAKRRLGAPAGHSTVYGVHVPDDHAKVVRRAAEYISKHEGRVAASSFVKRAKANAWDVSDQTKPWTVREEAALRKEFYSNLSVREICERHGRSKNSIIGKAHRLDLVRKGVGWRRTVPVREVAQMVRGHFDDEWCDWAVCALVCVCPMFIVAKPQNISAYTGLSIDRARRHYRTMNRLGIWSGGKLVDNERYTRQKRKDGKLEESDLQLTLDAGVLAGDIRSDGKRYWSLDTRP